jgi:ubiquinone/menaquinone biosynthesis C-methylase UbiE
MMDKRYQIEQKFHDEKAEHKESDFLYSQGVLHKADLYAYQLLEPLNGKVVLDIGCGLGYNSILFAKQGAYVYGIDISPKMIERAKETAVNHGVSERISFCVMNAEALEFADETFDIVYGHSILHHLDLEKARTEIYRVLKKGGIGVFLEPLGHNPFINLYRKLTPHRRTPTEKPLKIEDILFFAEPFSNLHHREFFLFALFSIPLLIFSTNMFRKIYNILADFDNFVMSKFPKLGRWAWVSIIQVTK